MKHHKSPRRQEGPLFIPYTAQLQSPLEHLDFPRHFFKTAQCSFLSSVGPACNGKFTRPCFHSSRQIVSIRDHNTSNRRHSQSLWSWPGKSDDQEITSSERKSLSHQLRFLGGRFSVSTLWKMLQQWWTEGDKQNRSEGRYLCFWLVLQKMPHKIHAYVWFADHGIQV